MELRDLMLNIEVYLSFDIKNGLVKQIIKPESSNDNDFSKLIIVLSDDSRFEIYIRHSD